MSDIGSTVTLRQLKTRLLKAYRDCPDVIRVWRMGEPESWTLVGERRGDDSVYRRAS